jgi:hypothetical protein
MSDWRKLHGEGFYDLYSSTEMIRVIKLRRIRWEDVVYMDKCMQGFGGEMWNKEPILKTWA